MQDTTDVHIKLLQQQNDLLQKQIELLKFANEKLAKNPDISRDEQLIQMEGTWYNKENDQKINLKLEDKSSDIFYLHAKDTDLEFVCREQSYTGNKLHHWGHHMKLEDGNKIILTQKQVERNPHGSRSHMCDCKWKKDGLYKIKSDKQYLLFGSVWVKKLI